MGAPSKGGPEQGLACNRCGQPAEGEARFCLKCGAELAEGAATAIGQMLDGRYRLYREIGRGAFGRVVEAVDEQEGTHVAIKLLNLPAAMPESEQKRLRASFYREWEAASRLRHPLITRMIATGSVDGQPYLVMEYAAGQTLRERLDAAGALPPGEGMAVMADVLSALQHAHGFSIIHRDVKPSNIIVGTDGRARLTDFGIAKILETVSTPRTQTGFLATPAYMSPEQASGAKIDHRADLFSAGLVAYELFTGRKAYRGNHPALVHQILSAPLPAAPEVSVPVMDWLQRACAKAPDDRFQTAAQMREALVAVASVGSELAAHAAVTAPRQGVPRPAPAPGVARPTRPSQALARIAGGLALFVAVVLGSASTAWWLRGRTVPAPAELKTHEEPASALPSVAPPATTPPVAVRESALPPSPSPSAPTPAIEATSVPPASSTKDPGLLPDALTPRPPDPTPSPDVAAALPSPAPPEPIPTPKATPRPSPSRPAAPKVVPTPAPSAPPVDEARQLLLKMIDAIGGVAKVDTIKDVSYHAKTKSEGLGLGKFAPDFDEAWVLPDHRLMDFTGGKVVVTPLKAFKKSLFRKLPLDAWDRQTYKDAFNWQPFVIAQRRDDLKLRVLDERIAAGGTGPELEIDLEGVVSRWVVDRTTGRYLQMSSIEHGSTGPTRQTTEFGDWTTVPPGISVPLSWRSRNEDGTGFSAKLSDYKINSGVSLSVFD